MRIPTQSKKSIICWWSEAAVVADETNLELHSALKGLADGLDTETGKEAEIQDNLQGFGLHMKDNIERRADVSEGYEEERYAGLDL